MNTHSQGAVIKPMVHQIKPSSSSSRCNALSSLLFNLSINSENSCSNSLEDSTYTTVSVINKETTKFKTCNMQLLCM